MHRMRRLVVTIGSCLVAASAANRAEAALLHPTDTSQFPDVSAAYVSGTINYSASSGTLSIQNTPYVMAMGTTAATQYTITADSAGQQSQTLTAQLDPDGTVSTNAANLYQLYGSVTVNGTTYNGLLLQGTPTAMGSLNLAAAPTNVQGSALFDFDIKVTGGLLAQQYGPEAYLRADVERWSTFNGGFAGDFSGGKVSTNIRSEVLVSPAAVPEPSTLVVLIACGGAGLLSLRRRRIALAELERTAA